MKNPILPFHKRRLDFVAGGFSLIELLVVLVISSIAGTAILSAVLWQSRVRLAQQETINIHQRARTILNFLQSTGRQTGFGYPRDPAALTEPCLGTCTNNPSPTYPSSPGYASTPYGGLTSAGRASVCKAVDQSGQSDRLRMIYLDPWLFYYRGQTKSSSFSCSTGAEPSLAPTVGSGGTDTFNVSEGLFLSPYQNTSSLPTTGASLGFVAGTCYQGSNSTNISLNLSFNSYASPILISSANSGPSNNCNAIYQATGVFGYGAGCPTYSPGYVLGVGEILDVFTANDPNTSVPSLYVRQFGWGPSVSLLSPNVVQFQVTYGFNTTAALDGQLSACSSCTDDPFSATTGGSAYAWCRDPRAADQGGSCVLYDDNGQALSTASLRNRFVAMFVSFTLQSDSKLGASFAPSIDANGYGNWTYNTLVPLQAFREHS